MVTSVMVTLLAITWAVMIGYGNRDLGHEHDWSDPTTAMFMVSGPLI